MNMFTENTGLAVQSLDAVNAFKDCWSQSSKFKALTSFRCRALTWENMSKRGALLFRALTQTCWSRPSHPHSNSEIRRDFIICLRCLNWDASQGLPVTSHLCGFNKYPVRQTQPSSAHPNAIPKLLLLIGNSVVSEWWTTLTSNPTLHVGTCWVAKTVFLFGFQASLTWHGFAIGKKESPLHHHWTKCNTITRSSPLTTFGFRAFPLKVSHERGRQSSTI